MLKPTFDYHDARGLRNLILRNVKETADPDGKNYILLSGGIDSIVIVYAFMELVIPFKVVNFYFDGMPCKDTDSVRAFQQASGIDVQYVAIPNVLENDCMPRIYDAVKQCRRIYQRIRKVKVETIYALQYTKEQLANDWTVFTGAGGGNLCCYSQQVAHIISILGEEHPEVYAFRHRIYDDGDETINDEFADVFSDMKYSAPLDEMNVVNYCGNFTFRSLNSRFPKSCLVYAFGDYFKKYKNARKPVAFQKACNEDILFEQLAQRYGYKSALLWFSSIDKQQRGKVK